MLLSAVSFKSPINDKAKFISAWAKVLLIVYRVVVPVSSPNSVAQVRQLVPSSFASRLNGVLVVQIGAYSDRSVAESQVSRLLQQGLSARIESINR